MTTTRAEWVIRGEGLTLGYGRRVLFRGVTVGVPRGDILGIVGPNGSGKTTLVRTLLGLLPPIGGTVTRRPGLAISYVPQRDRLDVSLPATVLEIVTMGLLATRGPWHRGHPADREAALSALGLLGDEALAPALFRDLSRGQQQRVLVARALACAPDLLVLDEPTAGMDIAGEHAMIAFLRDLNRRRQLTIVLVTHLLPVVMDLATSMLLMGRDAILQGPAEDVLQEARLTALYGVPVHVGAVAGRRTLVVGEDRRA